MLDSWSSALTQSMANVIQLSVEHVLFYLFRAAINSPPVIPWASKTRVPIMKTSFWNMTSPRNHPGCSICTSEHVSPINESSVSCSWSNPQLRMWSVDTVVTLITVNHNHASGSSGFLTDFWRLPRCRVSCWDSRRWGFEARPEDGGSTASWSWIIPGHDDE